MKQFAVPLILMSAVIACRPSSQTAAERRAEAARADSSAAGYEVGNVASAASRSDTSSSAPGAPSDSTHRATPAGMTATPVAVVSAPVPPPQHVATVPSPPQARSSDTSRVRKGRGPTSAAPGLPPLDPALEAAFLAYDTLKKRATFQLAAGTEVLDQVSFNGAPHGGRVLTIPIGWHVGIAFTNHDAELPHSAMVVAGFEAIPEQLPPPAFPQAQTVKADEGLLEGDSDEIQFLAARAGRYLIACGVLGHAQRGQWLVLQVSASATVPTYR